MTKAEFLERLRRALNGNMSAAAVEDNIQFYDSYFSGQIAQGRSEADVLNELGDPRILARTLIDAAERAGDARAHEANETQYRTSGYYTAGNGASGAQSWNGSASGRNASSYGRTGQTQGFRNHTFQGHASRSGAGSRSGAHDSWTQDDGMKEHSVFRIPGWLIALLVILILFVVVSGVGSLIWMILPYAIPVILVVYIVKLIGRK